MLRAWHGVLLPIGFVPLLAFWSGPHTDAVPTASVALPAPAGETLPSVILQLPDGTRTAPIPDPRLCYGAVRIQMPASFAGRTIDCCVHPLQVESTGPAAADWQLLLPVDRSGEARIANMPLGRYSLHAVLVDSGRVRIAVGEVELRRDQGPVRVHLTEVPGAR